MEYTPQLISDTTFELKEYTPVSISETTFELGDGVVQLLSPADLATGQSKTPTLSWEAYKPQNDRRYQVLVSTLENDFSNALQYITANTSFTIPAKDQLSGSTTYYWKVRPAVAVLLSEFSDTFNIADRSGWGANWTTQTLKESGTQEIVSNEGVLSIAPTDIAISVARLSGVTFDNLDLYLRNQSFTDVTTGSQPTYHFRTQGDWRTDNFITGYFLWLNGGQITLGRIPEGNSPSILATQSFTRSINTDYDIRIRADQYRIRIYIWQSSATEPSTPIIDFVDPNETFISGGFGIKLAGSIASNLSIDSISATFSEATAGTTVTSFAIDQSDSTLSANSSGQLTTTTQGTNVSGGATFASSDTDVVTVNNDGVYTWVSQGTATITATSIDDNSFTDTVQITAEAEGDFTFLNSQAGDEATLADFYTATNGDSWSDTTGWNNGTPNLSTDNPVGVTKAEVNGEWRVLEIDMQKVTTVAPVGVEVGPQHNGNNLTGNLNISSWGNLKLCEKVNVKQNQIGGTLPPSMGFMDNLKRLSLAGQRGEIDIQAGATPNHRGQGGGKNFEDTNSFDSQLPPQWGNLSNLEMIEIRHQRIKGFLPSEWGGMTSLRGIYIDNRRGADSLTGSIPPEWASMSLLESIYLGTRDNLSDETEWGPGLTGEIPLQFQQGLTTTNRFRIFLGRNSFEGDAPNFENIRDVREYRIPDNGFTGTFPIWLFNGDNRWIYGFDISNNNFNEEPIPQDGYQAPTFPSSSSSYNNISTLNISGNRFPGPIPQWILDMDSHVQLWFTSVGFTGAFPVSLAELPRMRLFYLNSNNFSGDLPPVTWDSDDLYEVLINANEFTGSIPESWSSMNNPDHRVWRFYANDNDLDGVVPSFFASSPTLEWLYLNNNRFTYSHILPNYQAILSTLETNATNGRAGDGGEKFYIHSQKPFNVPNESLTGTSSVTIDLSSIDYANNVYQWQRLVSGSWTNVSGETTHTLTTSTSGDYRLRITNDDLNQHPDPDFNLTESLSKTINVTVN